MIHIYYSNKKETPNTHFKQSNSFPEGQERVVHVHTQWRTANIFLNPETSVTCKNQVRGKENKKNTQGTSVSGEC